MPAPQIREDVFQTRVLEACRYYDIRAAHFRPAQTARGWRTPMQGQPGFPDLVLAASGRLLLVELKSDKGRLSTDQKQWIAELGEHAVVWRPRDWDTRVLPTLRSRLTLVDGQQEVAA